MAQSSKSTGRGRRGRPSLPAITENTSLIRIHEENPVDAQVAQLQGELVAEQANRKEERFGWIVAVGLLFTVLTFSAVGLAAGSVTTTVYVALLIFFSKRWGLTEFVESILLAHKLFGKKTDNGD